MIKRTVFLLCLALAGMSAQAFTLVDSKGNKHTLAQYKGKWVLVNFWATWCPPCIKEIPDLVELHENKKNNLIVLGVAMDYSDPKTVLQFADQMMVSYPIILGDQKSAAQIGTIPGLPATYLYSPQGGKAVAFRYGPLTKEEVERYIHAKK